MARIPYPDPSKFAPEAQQILAATPHNIARMMIGMGVLYKPVMSLASALINHGTLSPVLREILTIRVAHRMNAQYVLGQHEIMARSAGATDAQLNAISGPIPSPEFSDAENAAILLIDSLVDNVKAPEELVLNAYELLGEVALQEVFVICGFYYMMARYTESLGIDLDAGQHGNPLDQLKTLAHLGIQ